MRIVSAAIALEMSPLAAAYVRHRKCIGFRSEFRFRNGLRDHAGRRYLAWLRIQVLIQALTGIKTDVMTPLDWHERFRNQVVIEAQPL